MKISSIGTNADSKARVDISKVHGGYFADKTNLEKFTEFGLKPILSNLPKQISYVDFGGGQGHLAYEVKNFLIENGFEVTAIVADANDEYLKVAEKVGLETKHCNLEENNFSELDLVTMRAVLHYNTPENQKMILKNIYNSLKKGGYLVHQNSSGNKENCELRSAIVNIPELGRAGSGNYHWVSEEEYDSLLKEAGFTEIIHGGYAKANSWGPEEQWDRFNAEITKDAVENNNQEELSEIEARKKIYLEKTYKIIEEYSEKYGKDYIGIKESKNRAPLIEYLYPIVISKK